MSQRKKWQNDLRRCLDRSYYLRLLSSSDNTYFEELVGCDRRKAAVKQRIHQAELFAQQVSPKPVRKCFPHFLTGLGDSNRELVPLVLQRLFQPGGKRK